MSTKKIKKELSALYSEFVDHITDDDADELALRTISLLRQNGLILPNFSSAPKYLLIMEMEETPELQKLEEKLNNPEYNLKLIR